MTSNKNLIQLPKPEIFSFDECRRFLDRGYDDCLYTIAGGEVLKPLRIGEKRGLLKISEGSEVLEIALVYGELTEERIKCYITEWFDLGRDLRPFYFLLDRHKQLSWMSERYHGLRLMGIPDLFEALCWCVTGQQINLTFAHRLKRRLVETYGTFLSWNSKQHYFFPEPGALAGLQIKDLKDLQFSRQKAEYIIGIARDFASGNISKQEIAGYDNTKQMLDRLKEIRGVGNWTANYALMKSLGRPDCITHGDTGLLSAVSNILSLERKPERKEVDRFFEPFTGWESYLNIYLWRMLS